MQVQKFLNISEENFPLCDQGHILSKVIFENQLQIFNWFVEKNTKRMKTQVY